MGAGNFTCYRCDGCDNAPFLAYHWGQYLRVTHPTKAEDPAKYDDAERDIPLLKKFIPKELMWICMLCAKRHRAADMQRAFLVLKSWEGLHRGNDGVTYKVLFLGKPSLVISRRMELLKAAFVARFRQIVTGRNPLEMVMQILFSVQHKALFASVSPDHIKTCFTIDGIAHAKNSRGDTVWQVCQNEVLTLSGKANLPIPVMHLGKDVTVPTASEADLQTVIAIGFLELAKSLRWEGEKRDPEYSLSLSEGLSVFLNSPVVQIAFTNYMSMSKNNYRQLVTDLMVEMDVDMESDGIDIDECTNLVDEECTRFTQGDSPTSRDPFSVRRDRISRSGILAEVLHARGEADQFIRIEECIVAAANDEDGFTEIFAPNTQATKQEEKCGSVDNEEDFIACNEVDSDDELFDVQVLYGPSG
jgi:hypothetical protein